MSILAHAAIRYVAANHLHIDVHHIKADGSESVEFYAEEHFFNLCVSPAQLRQLHDVVGKRLAEIDKAECEAGL